MPPLRGSIRTVSNYQFATSKVKRDSSEIKSPPQINQSPTGKRPSKKNSTLESANKTPNGNMSSLKGLA